VTIQQARLQLAQNEGKLSSKQELYDRLKAQIQDIDDKLPLLEEALSLAKKCLEECLNLRHQIEDIVKAGMHETFEIPVNFLLESVLDDDSLFKGLKIKFSLPDGELSDPKDDVGAGMLSVASIFLVAAVLLVGGVSEALLVLDEQLATLKIERWRRLGEVLENLCRDSNLQIVFLTHSDEPFGKVYKVEMRKLKKGEEASFAYPVVRSDSGKRSWMEVPEE